MRITCFFFSARAYNFTVIYFSSSLQFNRRSIFFERRAERVFLATFVPMFLHDAHVELATEELRRDRRREA